MHADRWLRVMVTADGFTMTEERYRELRKLPWPEPNEETTVTSTLFGTTRSAAVPPDACKVIWASAEAGKLNPKTATAATNPQPRIAEPLS